MSDRTSVASALRLMADLIESGKIPEPSAKWPMVFCAADEEQAWAVASALGVAGRSVLTDLSDDGWPWMKITGQAAGIAVEVTADAGAVVLDPLTDDGIVHRFSLAEVPA